MHPEAQRLNALTDAILRAAIQVHKTLGPGLLESAYEACLYHELVSAGLSVERQKPLPLTYGEVTLDCAYRMDLVVENSVVIEVKAVASLGAVHSAQLISYLKISGLHVGLVINFNVTNLIGGGGVMRRVNNFPE